MIHEKNYCGGVEAVSASSVKEGTRGCAKPYHVLDLDLVVEGEPVGVTEIVDDVSQIVGDVVTFAVVVDADDGNLGDGVQGSDKLADGKSAMHRLQ